MKCIRSMLGLAPVLNGELFQSLNGEWRWRLKAANGEIVAQSEGYLHRGSAIDTLTMISNAKIKVVNK